MLRSETCFHLSSSLFWVWHPSFSVVGIINDKLWGAGGGGGGGGGGGLSS